MIDRIKEQIATSYNKIDILMIVAISLLAGLSGYLHDLVNSEEKFRKIVLLSRTLNAMLAGYIVGSLLSYYKVEPQIIYAIVGVTGWRGGLIIEHLSKAFISIIPELLLRIRVAIQLMISSEQHELIRNRLKNSDPYSMPVNETTKKDVILPPQQPQPPQPIQNNIVAPTTPTTPTNTISTAEDEQKKKLEEARKKLGLK